MSRGDDGFTLMEVIVALVLMGLATAIVARGFSNGRAAVLAAERVEMIASVARSRLAEVGPIHRLAPGRISGRDAAGLAWRIDIDPYDASSVQERHGAFWVRVTVWPGGSSETGGAPLTLVGLKAASHDGR